MGFDDWKHVLTTDYAQTMYNDIWDLDSMTFLPMKFLEGEEEQDVSEDFSLL